MSHESIQTTRTPLQHRKTRMRARRRGLAPLELVLWLPILLFVTALIVNFGTMAAWRVRGEVVSRDAVWRTRWPRTGFNEPRPAARIWPDDAAMTVKEDRPLTSLDDPVIQHPVVRGPLPNDFVVQPILDPDLKGSLMGESEIKRRYPLLPRLGSYESGEVQHPLLDEKWSVAQMRIRTNLTRRIPSIYILPKTPNQFPSAFASAVNGLFSMSRYLALRVLDQDAEVREFRGSYVDFHPRVNSSIASIDREEVQERAVDRRVTDVTLPTGEVVLGGVSRLPRTMTQFFLSMYRQAVAQFNRQIERMQTELEELPDEIARLARSMVDPSVLAGMRRRLAELPGLISQIRSRVAELNGKIAQLESFLARIPGIEDALRAR